MLQVAQFLSIGLLISSSILALLAGRVKRIPAQPLERILMVAFSWAILVPYFSGNTVSVLYGILFCLALASIACLCRDRNPEQVFALFRWVYLALILSILATQSQELFASLGGSETREIGLVRYTPLGMHTNQAGFVYGGGVLLFLQQVIDSNRKSQKIICAIGALACVAIVMAASARAALLALGVAGLVGMSLLTIRHSARFRAILAIGIVSAGAVLFVYSFEVGAYLTLILDLESDTRGLDSGGTGRFELWQSGVSLLLSDPIAMLAGSGLRSAGQENIGFYVESSYINLALEVGIIFAVIIVSRIIFLAYKLLGNFPNSAEMGNRRMFIGLMLVFAATQSIFNRYLLAVGNPYSLVVFFLYVIAELELRPSPRLTAY